MSAPVQDFAKWGPCDYITPMPFIHPDWKVVDIGPGDYPFPRANVYLDHNDEKLEPLRLAGKETILASLQDGLPEIKDHAFDFCWISHVLEHCLEIQKCVETLNRIARRGVMVVPSAYKDSLFCWEEEEHRWNVLPHPNRGGPPIFVEYNRAYISKLKDPMVQKAMCFLYRTGTHHDCTAERHLRAWYQVNEPFLDIVQEWSEAKPLKIQVIR